MKRKTRCAHALLEALENRSLLSAAPITISQAAVSGGTQLQITGTSGSDQVSLNQTATGLVVTDAGFAAQIVTGVFSSIKIVGGGGNDLIDVAASVDTPCMIYGGSGNDTLIAGAGNDSLWGGGGTDSLVAGRGNDTLVSIGDVAATLSGGRGFDSFWADNKSSEVIHNVTSAETAGGNVHQISNFLESGATLAATAITIAGQSFTIYTPPTGSGAIANPAVPATYMSFASDPLFSTAGPSANDIFQGTLGDCYYLGELSAVADINPNWIRQSICDLGDGTYAVQFVNGSGAKTYVRVDAQLPTSGGSLIYAGLGAQNSIWPALMEKAYAAVAASNDSYASINFGQTGQGFRAVGAGSLTGLGTYSNGQQLLANINADLLAGDAVSYSMGSHVYAVTGVDLKAGILTLRNPWGMYTTISAADAYTDFQGGAAALV